LIAAVAGGFQVAAWMTAMGSGTKVRASPVPPNLAWQELYLRSTKRAEVCVVKNFLTDAMKNKVFSISPNKMECIAGDKRTEFSLLGGFFVPKALVTYEETKAAVAAEVALECILFAQESDPNVKRATSTCIDPVKSVELDVPVFPVVAAYKGNHYKASVIERDRRLKETAKVGATVDFLVSNMPVETPLKKRPMEWAGVCFAPRIPYRAPKTVNQATLFQVIADHRRVRGSDMGRRSLYSKGYYYGYSDSPTSRALHLVADMENLARSAGSRFLEIQNVDGMFTEITLTSLVVNGWVIRVVNGYGLKTLAIKKGEKIVPGVYRSVTGCTAPFFVYHNLDEKTPTMVKDLVDAKYDVNLPPILERLEELKNKGEDRITFTYVYYRDELSHVRNHLYVTAHAHAAQLIFCSLEVPNGKEIDLHAYCLRVLTANAYKTGFTYYRIPYFGKDPFKFDFAFNMSIRAKLVPSKAWAPDDFEVTIIEDEIIKISIDYDELRRRAPQIGKMISVTRKVASRDEEEQVVAEAKRIDAENAMREKERYSLNQSVKNLPPERRIEAPVKKNPLIDFDLGTELLKSTPTNNSPSPPDGTEEISEYVNEMDDDPY